MKKKYMSPLAEIIKINVDDKYMNEVIIGTSTIPSEDEPEDQN